MLTPTETSNYERGSNISAGLCASCFKSLDADEVHVCEECEREMIDGVIVIKGILFCALLYVAYRYGWESAHSMVANECRRNGGFFVGKSNFKCIEVSNVESSKSSKG